MKKERQLLSNCCQARLITEHSDEGTSFYRCGACQKPCNIFVDSKVDTKQSKDDTCHCHAGGNYRDCKSHEVITCEHCGDINASHISPDSELPSSAKATEDKQEDWEKEYHQMWQKYGIPNETRTKDFICKTISQAKNKQIAEYIKEVETYGVKPFGNVEAEEVTAIILNYLKEKLKP